MLFGCTTEVVYIVFIAFYVIMNTIGYITKKAWFNLTSVIVNITLMIVHLLISNRNYDLTFRLNMNFDMLCLAINIPLVIIVDEIEIRRSVIKEVFKNKYKKK